MEEFFGDYSAAQTALSIIPVTPVNYGIRVHKVIASSAGVNLIHLVTGAAGAIRFELHHVAGGYTEASGIVVPNLRSTGLFTLGSNIDLDLTTTLSGAHSIYILYEVVKVTGGF